MLTANDSWLLPALDETGVRYLFGAPELARGHAPAVPIAPWQAESPTSGLEGEGKLVPIAMAAAVRAGARPHVSALWVIAASAALAALALAWAVGGVGGVGAAVLGGVLLLASPLTADAVTVVGPDVALAALVLLLLGALTYRPTGHLLHGGLAALAWATGPAGLGAAAVAVLWPMALESTPSRRVRGTLLALAPAAALVLAGMRWPWLAPPAWHWGGTSGLGAVLDGLAAWGGHGAPGAWGRATGAVLPLALALVALREARTAPKPRHPVAWSDPAAPDALALHFRPAAVALALGTAAGAAGAALGPLDRPWLATSLVLSALAAASVVRLDRRRRSALARAPLLLLLTWVAVGAWRTGGRLSDLRATGRGVTERVWVASPVIRWIDNRSAPYDRIYASEPALVLLQTGRGARSLPPPGGAHLDAFADRFAASPGAIVLTGGDATDAWAVTLSGRLGLTETVRAEEGRVLVPEVSRP